MNTTYLLHFRNPKTGAVHHYIGWTQQPVEKRLRQHVSGRGCKSTAKLIADGYVCKLAHTWPGGNHGFELYVKAGYKKPGNKIQNWCPVCGVNRVGLPRVEDYERLGPIKG